MSALALDYKQLANAIISNSASLIDPTTYNPEVVAEQLASRILEENGGRSLMVGPCEVRPGLNQAVPLGRAYQPIAEKSVSRLAAFLCRDEYGLVIREVPEAPEHGLRPSTTGVWVKEPGDADFRRLAPGEAVRITRQTEIRLGGNGRTGASGLPVFVV